MTKRIEEMNKKLQKREIKTYWFSEEKTVKIKKKL